MIMACKKGSKHHSSKITENDVKAIRDTVTWLTNKWWANELNVSDSAISLIRSGKTWKHL